MWVAKDGVREPALPELGLDLLRELRHRHARPDERRDGLHGTFHRPAGALHRLELVRALDAPEPVHERGARAEPIGPEDPCQVKRRLGPDAVADRDGCIAGNESPRDALEDRVAVVGLVHDDDLAVRPNGQVEEHHHARQDEDRIRVRPEEPARHPAVRVGALSEERDPALDPGEVLEIAREPDEEEVDALLAHACGEAALPSCMVEHASILGRGDVPIVGGRPAPRPGSRAEDLLEARKAVGELADGAPLELLGAEARLVAEFDRPAAVSVVGHVLGRPLRHDARRRRAPQRALAGPRVLRLVVAETRRFPRRHGLTLRGRRRAAIPRSG